jgi:hypothetical protein
LDDYRFEVRGFDSHGDLWVFASPELETVKYVAKEFEADGYSGIDVRHSIENRSSSKE